MSRPRVLVVMVWTPDRSRGLGAQAQAQSLTAEVLADAAGRMRDDMTVFMLKRP